MKTASKILGLASAIFLAGAAMGSPEAPGLQPLVSGTAHQALYAIAFQGDVGVAVGAAGQMIESSDSGKTWKTAPMVTPLALFGVALAKGHAVAVGQQGVVLTMAEDGSWSKVDSGTDKRLFSVAVRPDGLAVAVGAYGTILKSSDGGATWSSIAPAWDGYTQYGDQPHLYTVDVDDTGVITVAGEIGLILRSSDSGKSWQTLHKGDEATHTGDASLFAMQLRADGSGYAVGQNGTILHTLDHGKSWQTFDAGTTSILLGVNADANGHVVVTALHDMLLSSDHGKTWQHLGGQITSSWLEGIATPVSDQPALAVGEAGRVVRIVGG